VKVPQDVAYRTLDGEAVVLNLATGEADLGTLVSQLEARGLLAVER
jgi:hypothetical protein